MSDRRPPPGTETRAALRSFAASFWPFGVTLALLLMFGGDTEAGRALWPRAQILDAIRMVESSGRDNPPDGDGGRAIGPFQIHRPYWEDALRHEPALGGSYDDCRRRAYAERVVAAYMQHYAKDAWQRGRAEVIARIHNGGPTGDRLRATLGYWQRVRRHLPD